jgi:hypothetical protein
MAVLLRWALSGSVALSCGLLVLPACGGSSKRPWEKAAPCLRPLATFFDHGRPLSLPYRNPFGSVPAQMASPKTFERELELSYPAKAAGANAADFLFFAKDTDAARVLRRIRNTPNSFPTGNVETIGAAIVRWSSPPARAQRASVVACIGG